jgi:hypothetical protein
MSTWHIWFNDWMTVPELPFIMESKISVDEKN